MKVILLKDVPKVGKKYEMKNIADGYALNLLIPRGLAVSATPDAIKKVDLEKGRMEGEQKVHEALMMENLKKIDGAKVTLKEKANDKGHLFAGIHKAELIAKILAQTRVQLSPDQLILDKPIKEVGEYPLEVRSLEKSAKFKLFVEAEK